MAEARSETAILEWHRPVGKKALAIPLGIGAFLMTMGGVFVLLSLPRATGIPALSVAGAACIVLAPATVILSMLGVNREERCLILRRDAVVVQRGEEEMVIAWDDIDAVGCSDDHIEIRRRDGTMTRIEDSFTDAARIAEKMEDVRRKRGFNLV